MLLTKKPCDELETYQEYKDKKLKNAYEYLYAAISKVQNSSLKPEDKEEFKQNAAKLLITILK